MKIKGGMLRTLQTRCSIIASANPKGVYDNEDPLTINTALSSPLLSRFDLILLTLDTPNKEWDNIAATYITEGIDLLGMDLFSFVFHMQKFCLQVMEL